MLCKYCNNEINPNANFCRSCGKEITKVDLTEEVQTTPVYPYIEDTVDMEDEKNELGRSILIFSIIGLALSYFGISSLVGIIFAIIARTNLKKYSSKFGEPSGCAKVGKYLSIAALIVGIVMLCLSIMYVAYIVFLVVFVYFATIIAYLPSLLFLGI